MTNCSIIPDNIPVEEKSRIYRSLRYSRQVRSAELSKEITGHSVANCMRGIVSGSVHVKRNVNTGRAFYTGLITCGSVWDCPVCAAKISGRRNEEIKEARRNWGEQGGNLIMVTYTVRHNKGDRLSDLSRYMTDAIRFVKSGAPWKRIENKYGIAGSLTATEILYNPVNGWHYHKHQVMFIKNDVDININKLEKWIYARYNKYLNLHGFDSKDQIGVKISLPDPGSIEEDSIDYISKWGLEDELTKEKSNRSGMTPFELLDHDEYKDQFIEYSMTMKGKRRLTWSRGLRALVGLEDELSDEQIANAEDYLLDQVEEVVEITAKEWRYILKKGLRSAVLDHAEMRTELFLEWFIRSVSLPIQNKINTS